MQLHMRQIKRIEMVDAWTQTSNRGGEGEDKNRVHEGKIMIPSKYRNINRIDEPVRVLSSDASIKEKDRK